MADETTQAMGETAQHDMPVAMTVGPSGRLIVATAAGRVWEWDGKAKHFRAFAVLPGSQAEEEVRMYQRWRAQQAEAQAAQAAQAAEEEAAARQEPAPEDA